MLIDSITFCVIIDSYVILLQIQIQIQISVIKYCVYFIYCRTNRGPLITYAGHSFHKNYEVLAENSFRGF